MKNNKLHYGRDKPVFSLALFIINLNYQNLIKKFPTFSCINCFICFRDNMKSIRLKNYVPKQQLYV